MECPDLSITLGIQINYLRTIRGLSLRETARKIGVSGAFLSDLEKDNRFPSKRTLDRILIVLADDSAKLQMTRQIAAREVLKRYGFEVANVSLLPDFNMLPPHSKL